MHRPQILLGTLLLAASFAAPGAAQQVRVFTSTDGKLAATVDGDRAMIGVSTSSGSRRDTLGVLVSSVTEGGPAEKAGLSEGDRIQSINGVSLRVNRDDAGDDEISGIMQRRLTRELGKVKAGDEVTLQVWHDGASRTYKVKTVAADDLYKPMKVRTASDDRAVLGLGYGLTGSKRDTAGVFVNSVTEEGPAEKAGIVEGDRIAAINGVSLRLSKDDIDDGWMANARVNRLSREMAKVKAGDVVDLTVVSGGRARQVKVTSAKASTLKKEGGRGFTIFRTPETALAPMAPMPPMGFAVPAPPKAPAAPRVPIVRYRDFDSDDVVMRLDLDDVRREVERTVNLTLPRVRAEIERAVQIELPRVRYQTQRTLDLTRINARPARTIRM